MIFTNAANFPAWKNKNQEIYATIKDWDLIVMALDDKNGTEQEGRVRFSFPLEWVSRSREGDPEAMESLYGQFKSPFYGIAFRYTANSAVSEDLLQDIFVKIFTNLDKLDNDEAFSGWAFRIAVNTCLSYLRRRKTQLSKSVAMEDVEYSLADNSGRQHENLLNQPIEDALSTLSNKLKSVFMLHDIQGFKHTEIAQMLGCSVGTSKSQLFKARMKIRKQLAGKQLI